MNEKPLITASIVTYNNFDKAVNAVASLKQYTKKYPLKLYVFDNASKNVDLYIKRNADVFIKNSKNIGFGAAHNKISEHTIGKYHAVINPDITVSEDVLSTLADILEANPDICMITPKILNTNGTEQKLPKKNPSAKYIFAGRLALLGGIFKKIRNEYILADENLTDLTDIDFCTGCFFMIRSDVFKMLGGFDENYFMYLEDADLTRRAKKYGRVVYCPFTSVTHIWERGSAKNIKLLFIHLNSYFKYRKKWKNEL